MFLILAAALVLASRAAAEITVAVSHRGNASSSTPVPGSQLAVVYESMGADEFDVSGEAVRLRQEDLNCDSCPPTFVGDPPEVTGKVAVADSKDIAGCGCNMQDMCRNFAASNVMRGF